MENACAAVESDDTLSKAIGWIAFVFSLMNK